MLTELTARQLLETEKKYDDVCDKHDEESPQALRALRSLESARKVAMNELIHALAEQRIYGAVQQLHQADADGKCAECGYAHEPGVNTCCSR